MHRLAFLVSALVLAVGFSLNVRATTEMSFVDAKAEFANLHRTFQSDVKTLELARDAELKRLNDLLVQLNKDLKACPTYTCVKETKAAIAQAEQDKQVAVREADRQIQPMKVDFVRTTKRLAVASFSYELKALAAKTKELENFTPDTDSYCEPRESVTTHRSQYVSRQMVCRQLNVEFKYKGTFYKMKLALGLPFGETDHVGNPKTMAESELADAQTIFAQTSAQMMAGINVISVFTGDPKYATGRPLWSQVSDFGYYGMEFYHMYNATIFGLYTVAVDQI